jgi:hypothetical protein
MSFEWSDEPAQGREPKALRVLNRQATRIEERNGVRLSGASGNGVAWVEGTDFRSGAIEVDIRGREDMGQTYLGIAFHRKDDATYEAVYLRPFNFRIDDPLRRQHAVQYISMPEFDFQDSKLQVYVGLIKQVTLEVRKLGRLEDGQVGLWVGNDSGGDFANLIVTPAK